MEGKLPCGWGSHVHNYLSWIRYQIKLYSALTATLAGYCRWNGDSDRIQTPVMKMWLILGEWVNILLILFVVWTVHEKNSSFWNAIFVQYTISVVGQKCVKKKHVFRISTLFYKQYCLIKVGTVTLYIVCCLNIINTQIQLNQSLEVFDHCCRLFSDWLSHSNQ